MGISRDTVKYVANLAHIKLSAKEEERLSKQLKQIINFVDKLKEVDISSVEPTSHILSISNVFREDRISESLALEDVLNNAPQTKDGFFVVPKVI
jgi:aspartyl-tRNA(Asn)/glutamyl-tRNA(Gln) amidotransferase subunit C